MLVSSIIHLCKPVRRPMYQYSCLSADRDCDPTCCTLTLVNECGNQLLLKLYVLTGAPGGGEEPQFLLVHARPFLLTYEPDALNPWALAITTNRMPAYDGTSEVVGQVRKAGKLAPTSVLIPERAKGVCCRVDDAGV